MNGANDRSRRAPGLPQPPRDRLPAPVVVAIPAPDDVPIEAPRDPPVAADWEGPPIVPGPRRSPAPRRPSNRELLRRALSSPHAARQAYVLREVLGPPVSLRTGEADRDL